LSKEQLPRLWHRVVNPIKTELLILTLFGILVPCSHAPFASRQDGPVMRASSLPAPRRFLSLSLPWIFQLVDFSRRCSPAVGRSDGLEWFPVEKFQDA